MMSMSRMAQLCGAVFVIVSAAVLAGQVVNLGANSATNAETDLASAQGNLASTQSAHDAVEGAAAGETLGQPEGAAQSEGTATGRTPSSPGVAEGSAQGLPTVEYTEEARQNLLDAGLSAEFIADMERRLTEHERWKARTGASEAERYRHFHCVVLGDGTADECQRFYDGS